METKKILIIKGSGRPHGNTAQLIDSFAKGAGEAGHSIEIISLKKNEVKGCFGLQCLSVRKTLRSEGFI